MRAARAPACLRRARRRARDVRRAAAERHVAVEALQLRRGVVLLGDLDGGPERAFALVVGGRVADALGEAERETCVHDGHARG